MAGRPMAAVDAQMLLLSAKIANDQFALFAFDGAPDDLGAAVGQLRDRARQCADLCLRVADEHPWRYPRWVPGPVTSEQFIVHAGTGGGWQSCLDRVSRLSEQQLDAAQMCWRVHVFPDVTDVPGASAACGQYRSERVDVDLEQLVYPSLERLPGRRGPV